MRRTVMVASVLLGWSSALAAQRPLPLEGGGPSQPSIGRPGGRNGGGRIAVERQVRQRLAQRAQAVVGLTDDQMTKLAAMDREFTPRRIDLMREEMATRQGLRRAMADSTNVDQSRIAEYTSKLVDVQRRRADLLDAEQKQLGTFMTPLQRAKYLALEEQVRRMVTQRLTNAGREAPPPPR